MSNLIKFKLQKDLDKNVIVFTLLSINREHKLLSNNRGFHINFQTKKVVTGGSWPDCHIDQNRFSIYFDRGSGHSDLNCKRWENAVFMIGTNTQNMDYVFNLPTNDMDFWYNRIIESFKILSEYK